MKWEKTGKLIRQDATIISYENGGPYRIESRKVHIPHANGRSGTWDHTSYFVIIGENDLKEFMTLKDAKQFVERMESNELAEDSHLRAWMKERSGGEEDGRADQGTDGHL